jgi:hypothetical protein
MYTSKQILAMNDLYKLQGDASCGIPISYVMTGDELGWLDWMRGRYCIADYIDEHRDGNVLTIDDCTEMSQSLNSDCDGYGKAVCLSDDTALQKIFFWLWSE